MGTDNTAFSRLDEKAMRAIFIHGEMNGKAAGSAADDRITVSGLDRSVSKPHTPRLRTV